MKSNAIEKSQPRMTDRDWLPSIKKLIYKRNNYTNNQELLKQWHNVRAETRNQNLNLWVWHQSTVFYSKSIAN